MTDKTQAKTDADAAETAAAKAETDAKAAAEAAKTAAKTAADAVTAAREKIKDGLLGFCDWMLTKTGLSTDQQEDVRKAQRYYSLEDGVWKQDWDYAYDAYTLDNLKTATTLLDEINKVRASDENFKDNASYKDYKDPVATNFYRLMGSAAATNYARIKRDHGRANEVLAWTPGDSAAAVKLWQDEKTAFDELRTKLGMTAVEAVESYIEGGTFYQEAEKLSQSDRTKEVGHYVLIHDDGAETLYGAGVSSYAPYTRSVSQSHVYEMGMETAGWKSTAATDKAMTKWYKEPLLHPLRHP